MASKSKSARRDDLIEDLFAQVNATKPEPSASISKALAKIAKKGKESGAVVKKRLTKKEKKIMESQSQNRTLVDIISDTKSGQPLKSAKEKTEKRKREKKAEVKTQEAREKAVLEVNSSSLIKDESVTVPGADSSAAAAPQALQPVVKIIDGKTVIQMPTTISTSKAIANIKHSMGPSVVQNRDKKMSSLDFKTRDSTDRWSKRDTE